VLGATITFGRLLGFLFPGIKEPEWNLTRNLHLVSILRIAAINKHKKKGEWLLLGLYSPGMVGSVDWYFVTDVLGQFFGPVFRVSSKMGYRGCIETSVT
jgi:hypothetical protein